MDGPARVLEGFVDTLAEISGFDLEHPILVRFYNPVAAMPSLHVAFAVVMAGAMAERASPRSRRPPPTRTRRSCPSSSGTGNHYVLDTIVGAALGSAARRLVTRHVTPAAGAASS
jgi:PAP2 superfamily protein